MLILHNPHKFLVEYSITCMPSDVFSATPVVGTVKPLVRCVCARERMCKCVYVGVHA